VRLGRVVLLLVTATALQFFFGSSRLRGGWAVDWFLIATAAVARGGDFARTVLVGAAAGFLEDGLSHELLGMNAFAKAAIGYALALVAMRVVVAGPWAVGAVVAIASLANDAIVGLLASLLLRSPLVLLTQATALRAMATGAAAGLLEAAWNFPWREWWQKRRLRRLR
jgi:rod shape-determining protein MreD